ncbi:FAD-dependent oxidoreductase [Thermosyntropha sp.]|uniref:FAD-dependent oxidoreductase n=1 Tax=Thermosyntropha sp. TaxID=2740820 RepID=UPI0025D6A437|nr:FAD-dependent oxidoreductase [Thermosyntropha sp.]MBO8158717.1 FAD-dependent oxidoreductase [Thermosyntropha sp.]
MAILPVSDGVYYVGVQDPNLRVFDIVMSTEYGTSYNAYLVKGREKTALIETVKVKFFDQYINNLQEIIDLSSIDYLIMNHTEPDHAGSVERLLEKIPNLTILGSATALTFLKAITNKNFSERSLNDGEEIDLGGKTLNFISAPFLHWPDSGYTYLKEDGILFTCDSFGCHYADNKVFNDLIEGDFYDAYKYYFDVIMGPFKSYVLEALEKIKDLNLKIICPGHGPVLRTNLGYYIDLYKTWAQPEVRESDKPLIVIAYVSAYGYTETLAKNIAEGILTVGEFEVKMYDLIYADKEEVLREINLADGILIGSPTINGDALPPIWELLIKLSPIVHAGKVAAAFGAYGWSGEAVPAIENRLKALRMKVLPGLKVNFKPSMREEEEAFTMGMEFGKAILNNKQDSSKNKWRCVVCGYEHEGAEPPEVCPACGVGKENFVLVEMEDEFINDTNEKFVIIGSGIAALTAAENIRKRNRTASIIMLTEEKYLPYYRPVLSDLLSEDLPEKKIYIHDEEWYRERNIEVKLGIRVSGIDASSKKVIAENGEEFSYNKLIIATGASSNVPPIPGADLKGVYTMRSLEDALKLKEAMKDAKKAVVIGGGVLGLEAVWEMVSAGLKVAVIEGFDRIMPRQLDVDASRRLEEMIKSYEIELYLGVGVETITGENDRVSGVKLKDGIVLEADLVLLSTGVRPNVALAKEAGIEVGQGIIVDEKMRTSVSDVYAAGDVAQFGERVIGLWPVSMEMGRVAGAVAAGDWLEYKQPLISTMLMAFGKEIFSVGEVNLDPKECRIVEVNDPVNDFYKKSFIKDGVLVGEIVIAAKVDTTQTVGRLGRDESGNKKYNKWECRVCGYIHEGPEPPDECPVCGAPKDMFDLVEG